MLIVYIALIIIFIWLLIIGNMIGEKDRKLDDKLYYKFLDFKRDHIDGPVHNIHINIERLQNEFQMQNEIYISDRRKDQETDHFTEKIIEQKLLDLKVAIHELAVKSGYEIVVVTTSDTKGRTYLTIQKVSKKKK